MTDSDNLTHRLRLFNAELEAQVLRGPQGGGVAMGIWAKMKRGWPPGGAVAVALADVPSRQGFPLAVIGSPACTAGQSGAKLNNPFLISEIPHGGAGVKPPRSGGPGRDSMT